MPGLSPDASVIVSTDTNGGFAAFTGRVSVPFAPSLAVTVSFTRYLPATVVRMSGVFVPAPLIDPAPAGAPFGTSTIFHRWLSLERAFVPFLSAPAGSTFRCERE